ncbi:hypothetical protein ACFWEJ_12295 [Promicromonospora sp. NPDC060204]|uniref:hypothetical protein n=1 Tax=Promicromonospora sp. NPDC060204 TaxID=3347071 RepID=UPI00365D3ABC
MRAKTEREYARQGLVVLVVSGSVVVYLALDPGWPFLVSVLVFATVVPGLAWLVAGAVYPREDRNVPVPIDRGSGDGYTVYLGAEPTGERERQIEMFLMINGASRRSIQEAGLTAGSPVFIRVAESEARQILAEMSEFGIQAHLARETSRAWPAPSAPRCLPRHSPPCQSSGRTSRLTRPIWCGESAGWSD